MVTRLCGTLKTIATFEAGSRDVAAVKRMATVSHSLVYYFLWSTVEQTKPYCSRVLLKLNINFQTEPRFFEGYRFPVINEACQHRVNIAALQKIV